MNALDELRRLLDASTPGPWEAEPNPDDRGVVTWLLETAAEDDDNQWAPTLAEMCDRPDSEANLALIVFLRNHAEDLLAVARAMWERGWNADDGKCWCEYEPEYDGMKHARECRALKEVFSRLSPTSEEGS